MSRTRHLTIWSLPVIRRSPVFSQVWLLFALALTSFGSRNAGAQSRSDLLVQVGAGIGHGAGGDDYRSRTGFAVDALVARASPGTHSRLLALQAAAQGWPGTGDSCEPTPAGACREDFPVFYSLTALLGRAWGRTSSLNASVLIGPGIQLADDGGSALALSGRAQGGIRIVAPVEATLSLSTSLLPNYRGDVLLLTSLKVGLSLGR